MALTQTLSSLAPILAWQSCSILLIFFNKHVFTAMQRELPQQQACPVTLMLMHQLFSALATRVLARAGLLSIPALPWHTTLTSVLPLGALSAGSTALSNLAAARLHIPSTQMLKALAPLCTLAVMFCAGMGRARLALVPIVACLVLGGALVNAGDLHFDALGVALQVAALLCEAVRMVAVKATLEHRLPPRSSPLVALALFAPMSAACLLPLSLALEGASWGALLGSSHLTALAMLSCLGALGLNCCNVWLLSRPSGPLLLSLAGVVKDMGVVLLAILAGGSVITRAQTAGYALALLGLNTFKVHSEALASGAELQVLALLARASSDLAARLIGVGSLVILLCSRA